MPEPQTTKICRSCNKHFTSWQGPERGRPPVFCKDCFKALTPEERLKTAQRFSRKRRNIARVEETGETHVCLKCESEYKAVRYRNGLYRRFCQECWPNLTQEDRSFYYNEEQKKSRRGPYAIHKPAKPSTDEEYCRLLACRYTADIDGYCTFHWKQRHLYE